MDDLFEGMISLNKTNYIYKDRFVKGEIVEEAAANLNLSLEDYFKQNPGFEIAQETREQKDAKLDLQNRIVKKSIFKSINPTMPDWIVPYAGALYSTGSKLISGIFEGIEAGYENATGMTKQEQIDDGINPVSEFLNNVSDLTEFSDVYYDSRGNHLDKDRLIEQGRYLDAAKLSSQEAVGNAPSMLAYRFPVVGSALLGLSTFGSTFKEDLKNRPDETAESILKNSLWAGGSEMGTELAGGLLFRKLGIINAGGAGKKQVKDFTRSFFNNFIRKSTGGMITEGVTEAMTAASQKFGESTFYGDVNTTEDYARAMFNAALPAMMLGGGTGIVSGVQKTDKNQLYSYLAPKSWKNDQLKIGKKIEETLVDMSNADSGNKQWFADQIDVLRTKAEKNTNDLVGKFEAKSNVELENYAQNNVDISNLRTILNNDKYSEDAQKVAQDKINTLLTENQKSIGKDVFDVEVESSGGVDVLVSEFVLNGYQF